MVIAFVIVIIVTWGLCDYFSKSKKTDWDYVKFLKNLDNLDIWDGIEGQIKLKMRECHPTSQNQYAKFSVHWRNNSNLLIDINLDTVAINRQYWKSGLSAHDFAKKYYSDLGITESKEKFCTAPNEIMLYDRNGNSESFWIFSIDRELREEKLKQEIL
ncbi:MAG: hypothetical protein ACI4TK_04825 [Agathobacter sp.]